MPAVINLCTQWVAFTSNHNSQMPPKYFSYLVRMLNVKAKLLINCMFFPVCLSDLIKHDIFADNADDPTQDSDLFANEHSDLESTGFYGKQSGGKRFQKSFIFEKLV